MLNGLKKLNIDYDNEVELKFDKYRRLLKEWNEKINITSIKDDTDIYIKHFLDSLVIIDEEIIKDNHKIIDIGTGGGFPGLPLKIILNDLDVTLLDSLKKRTIFLSNLVNELELDNVEIIHGRAEDYGQDIDYREQYDICVSRAVSSLNVLSEYCLPFVKKGGFFIAYKSENVEEEIENSKKAINILGGKIKYIRNILIPNTEIVRKLVIIEKIGNTSKKYPRKAGKPSKNPI